MYIYICILIVFTNRPLLGTYNRFPAKTRDFFSLTPLSHIAVTPSDGCLHQVTLT